MAIVRRYRKKRKKICYQAQVYIKGVRQAYKSFKTKTEAVTWHKEQKEKLSHNLHSSGKRKSEISFLDCFNKYRKEGFSLLKRSSRESYECRFRYFTDGPLSHIQMEEFKAQSVYNWIEWLKNQETVKNIRRKTFLRELELLQTILNWYKNFIDEDFHVPITKKHKKLCYYKPVTSKRPDYYAKPEELRAFIKWLRENTRNPVYWRIALFMILTGARVSEACGLCWSSVDLKRGQARIVQKMGWDYKTRQPYLEKTTKTDASVRILLLSEELIKVLNIIKEENQNKEGLVFLDRDNLAMKYNNIQAAFNKGFKALKLPWRSTHILRHSYATGALIATQNISAVQATLGHTSSRMTEKYAKVIALLDKKVAEKTTKFFDIFNNKSPEN